MVRARWLCQFTLLETAAQGQRLVLLHQDRKVDKMKLKPFKLDDAKWDRYKAFYLSGGPGSRYGGDGPIIQFDTGEVIIQPHHWGPDERGRISDYNIGVIKFGDGRNMPTFTTPEGEPLPLAHLDHRDNHRSVVVDYDTGHVVSLADLTKDTRVPVRLRQAAMCYFSGAEQEPVGGPIIQSKPRKLPKDQREHLDGLIQACRAWAKLEGVENKGWGYTESNWEHLLTQEFADLDEKTRLGIAQRGIHV
jgi:hypothetical protein